MTERTPEAALRQAAIDLRQRAQPFALVGGLGVSIRGEVRFEQVHDRRVDQPLVGG